MPKPSEADVQQVRASLNRIVAVATLTFRNMWVPIQDRDFGAQRAVLDEGWPSLLDTYGDLSAVLMADVCEDWSPGLKASPVRAVDSDRAGARMRWAIGTAEPQQNLELLVDELVKQPARSTVARAATQAKRSWSRIPSAGECDFCRQFAGHRFTGRHDKALKFHGACDCVAVLNI